MSHALAAPDRATSDHLLAQAHEWADADAPTKEIEVGAWSWADMRAAAKIAASRTRTTRGDVFDLALSGVCLAVTENPSADWASVVAAGQREIWDDSTALRRDIGIQSSGDMPHFWRYWLDPHNAVAHLLPGRADSAMTLRRVLEDLPERHRATLLALALTGNVTDAAHMSEVPAHTFRCRLLAARRAALTLWFDGETPPPLSRLPINTRGRDRTCPRGHLIAGENVKQERRGGRVVERCRICRLDQQQRNRLGATQ